MEAIAFGGKLISPETLATHKAAAETARAMLEVLRLEDLRTQRYNLSADEIRLLRGTLIGLADLRDFLESALKEHAEWGEALSR